MHNIFATSGYEVTEGIGKTGVVGLLRNGAGPVVMLRGDMDALPIKEQTGVDYASEVFETTSDGSKVPVMHACGHDIHVACLIATAELLANKSEAWRGTAFICAQPAEETGQGSEAMLKRWIIQAISAAGHMSWTARFTTSRRNGWP